MHCPHDIHTQTYSRAPPHIHEVTTGWVKVFDSGWLALYSHLFSLPALLSLSLIPFLSRPPFPSVSVNFSMQMYGECQIYLFRISKTWECFTHHHAAVCMSVSVGVSGCTLQTGIRCLSIWTTSKHFALFLFSYRSHLHKTLKAF